MLEPVENRTKVQWFKDQVAMLLYQRKIYKELLSSDEIKVVELKKLRYIRLWVEPLLVYMIFKNTNGYIIGKIDEFNWYKTIVYAI